MANQIRFGRRCALGRMACVAFGLATLIGLSWNSVVCAEDPSSSRAERLVNAALRAEAAGDVSGRAGALRGAVQISPDLKTARWQAGDIQVDGQWLAVEKAQQLAAGNPQMRQYLEMRDQAGNDLNSQLALTRWCLNNNLSDEMRFHAVGVLANDPDNAEAMRILEVHWHKGRLLTREQISRAKEQDAESAKSARTWRPKVADWLRQLGGDITARTSALKQIQGINSVEAIPLIEKVTLGSGEMDDEQVARVRQVSMAFLDAIEALADRAALESLVRHAVLSPVPSVRASAVARLKKRAEQDYVPILLQGLQAPIESSYRLNTWWTGDMQYRHELYRQGPFGDWAAGMTRNVMQEDLDGRIYYSHPWRGIHNLDLGPSVSDSDVVLQKAAIVRSQQQKFATQAQAIEKRIARINQSVKEINAAIVPVLAQTTGQDYGSDPTSWWNWWQDHNEYYSDGITPVYSTECSDLTTYFLRPDRSYTDNYDPTRKASCFVAGTPVWTKIGLRPVESLRFGDMVLSQNVDTGELAYKPVIGTTVRPASPIVRLTIEGEQILATRGHPLWVTGKGWQMAKELADGNLLRGVKQPLRLDSVREGEQEKAYNLIVADFSTYFVGQHGVLVHDNTPRRPTRAVIPGATLAQFSDSATTVMGR